MSVVAASLHRDKAYARIRDLVISGEFAPREPLSERQPSDRLALGETPVREALEGARHDGLSRSIRCADFVRGIVVRDLREIHELRLALEGMAAYLAATRGPKRSRALCKGAAPVGSRATIDMEERSSSAGLSRRTVSRHRQWPPGAGLYNARPEGLALQKMRHTTPTAPRQASTEHLDIHAAVAAQEPTPRSSECGGICRGVRGAAECAWRGAPRTSGREIIVMSEPTSSGVFFGLPLAVQMLIGWSGGRGRAVVGRSWRKPAAVRHRLRRAVKMIGVTRSCSRRSRSASTGWGRAQVLGRVVVILPRLFLSGDRGLDRDCLLLNAIFLPAPGREIPA